MDAAVTCAQMGLFVGVEVVKKEYGRSHDQRECAYEHCGSRFKPTRANHRYCSPMCGWRALHGRPAPLSDKLTCAYEHCDEVFVRKAANSKYCSPQCGYAARRGLPKLVGKRIPYCHPQDVTRKQCAYTFCDETFLPIGAGSTHKRYCSRLCRARAAEGVKPSGARACAYELCDNVFEPRTVKDKYCGKECGNRDRRIKRIVAECNSGGLEWRLRLDGTPPQTKSQDRWHKNGWEDKVRSAAKKSVVGDDSYPASGPVALFLNFRLPTEAPSLWGLCCWVAPDNTNLVKSTEDALQRGKKRRGVVMVDDGQVAWTWATKEYSPPDEAGVDIVVTNDRLVMARELRLAADRIEASVLDVI